MHIYIAVHIHSKCLFFKRDLNIKETVLQWNELLLEDPSPMKSKKTMCWRIYVLYIFIIRIIRKLLHFMYKKYEKYVLHRKILTYKGGRDRMTTTCHPSNKKHNQENSMKMWNQLRATVIISFDRLDCSFFGVKTEET